MDNLEMAKKQMKVISSTFGKEGLTPNDLVTYSNMINTAHFYVQYDIAESLRNLAQIKRNLDVLAGFAMEDK